MSNWSCVEQAEAARQVFIKHEGCVLVAFPCGMGKSLTFLLPFSLAPTGFTVVVVPYRALLQDAIAHARGHGLECEVFDKNILARFGPNAIGTTRSREDSVRFVFVVADTAVSPDFMSFLETARRQGCLNGIVFDEAHQILVAQSYREPMRRVRHLARFGCLLVLVSGTSPPCFERSLLGELGFQPDTASIHRRPDSYQKRLLVDLFRLP